MKSCKSCPAFGKCTVAYRGSACDALRSSYKLDSDLKIKTNAEKIRTMNDENLAKFLCNICKDFDIDSCIGCVAYSYCKPGHNGMIDWLKQPAEKGKHR